MLRRLRSARAVFVSVLIVGCVARLGYGAARYGESLTVTGADFISQWDHDALEHILIAKSLIETGEYRVAWVPGLESKQVRSVGHDGSFKAPLYQLFLAGVFAVSGYNFLLLFPLQALVGGILSGLVALIALEAFGRRTVALFAGLAAAMHPVLVNSASQPYNENLSLALLFGSLYSFIRWRRAPRLSWALACGALGGLAILCRESAGSVLLGMVGFGLFTRPPGRREAAVGITAIIAVAGAIVAPWLVRNAGAYGTLSISSGSAHVLGIGNNECLAREPIHRVYWAEGPCAETDARRSRLLVDVPFEQRSNAAVIERLDGALGMAFIRERPLDYARLSLRRAWTVLLPFNPRQQTGRVQRTALLLYWLIIVPAGIAGLIRSIRGLGLNAMLLALMVALIILPLVLIYFTPDGRYRVPADLLLACFAGQMYATVAAERSRSRPSPDRVPAGL